MTDRDIAIDGTADGSSHDECSVFREQRQGPFAVGFQITVQRAKTPPDDIPLPLPSSDMHGHDPALRSNPPKNSAPVQGNETLNGAGGTYVVSFSRSHDGPQWTKMMVHPHLAPEGDPALGQPYTGIIGRYARTRTKEPPPDDGGIKLSPQRASPQPIVAAVHKREGNFPLKPHARK